jgi:hypothetical protein
MQAKWSPAGGPAIEGPQNDIFPQFRPFDPAAFCSGRTSQNCRLSPFSNDVLPHIPFDLASGNDDGVNRIDPLFSDLAHEKQEPSVSVGSLG